MYKMLIVQRDGNYRKALQGYAENLGYKVMCTDNLQDASKEAKTNSFDVVISGSIYIIESLMEVLVQGCGRSFIKVLRKIAARQSLF